MILRLMRWENWELEGLFFLFFFGVMSVQRTSALRTQTKIVETHNFNGDSCTRQLVLDQHNKSQSYHGLLKLHLVSKLNLRKRKTKSLSGWKLKSCRSSENLSFFGEKLSDQIVTDNYAHGLFHDVFTKKDLMTRNKIAYCCLASFCTLKRLLVNGLDTSISYSAIR